MARFTFFVVPTLFVLAGCKQHDLKDITMPPECEGQNYCHIKPDIYDIYENDMELKIRGSNLFSDGDDDDIGAVEYSDEPEGNCESKIETTMPYIVKTHGINHLVPQTSFKQIIKETKCIPKTSCFENVSQFQSDIEGKCVEQTTNIMLYLYNGTHIVPENIPISIGCACIIRTKYLEYN